MQTPFLEHYVAALTDIDEHWQNILISFSGRITENGLKNLPLFLSVLCWRRECLKVSPYQPNVSSLLWYFLQRFLVGSELTYVNFCCALKPSNFIDPYESFSISQNLFWRWSKLIKKTPTLSTEEPRAQGWTESGEKRKDEAYRLSLREQRFSGSVVWFRDSIDCGRGRLVKFSHSSQPYGYYPQNCTLLSCYQHQLSQRQEMRPSVLPQSSTSLLLQTCVEKANQMKIYWQWLKVAYLKW